MAIPNPYFDKPPAYMGYVGFVELDGAVIRATSADLKLTQEITSPTVVDGRIDPTVYQLGPKEVGGGIAFPAIYDTVSGATTVANMWKLACQREAAGTLVDFNTRIKYANPGTYNSSSFLYEHCIVNTMQVSVTQSDVMNISMDLIGLTRDSESQDIEDTVGIPDALDNSRIVTWADSRIEINGNSRDLGLTGNQIGGQFIRSFEINVNNNATRFYTMNKNLFAQAVAPAKREVNGNCVFMGRLPGLGQLAVDNELYAYEDTEIVFGFKPSIGSDKFIRKLPNVVFSIEEMSITNDLFETTVQWRSLPAAFIAAGATTTSIYDPLLDESFDTTY